MTANVELFNNFEQVEFKEEDREQKSRCKKTEVLPNCFSSQRYSGSASVSASVSKKRKVCELNISDHADGNLYQGDLGKVVTMYRDEPGDNDLPGILKSTMNLDYDAGMDIFQGPIKVKAESDEDIDAAILQYNEGQAFRKLGDRENALQCYQLALNNILPYLAGFGSIPTKEVNRIAIPVLYNLALVQYLNGANEESVGFLEFALQESRKSEGKISFTLAAILKFYGNVLYHTKDLKNSLRCLKESLQIFTRLFGVGSKWEAIVLNSIGRVNVGMGDHSTAAMHFKRATVIRRKLLGDFHIDYDSSTWNSAQCFVELC